VKNEALDAAYPGRLGLQQRVVPAYRVPFFTRLAAVCSRGLQVFAGEPRRDEGILAASDLDVDLFISGKNQHILGGPLYICYQEKLLQWLEDWNPDAMVLEANPRYISNWAALRWMRQKNRPVIGWGLGAPIPKGIFASIRKVYRQRFLNSFDALIAYSTLGADQYRKLGVREDRVFVAPNAAASIPGPLPPREFIPQAGLNVLFVGRLQVRKRVDHLLQACAALKNPPKLTIVGDGPARGDLETLAGEVYPQARFVGAQQGESLDAYFREADLFVLPGTGGLAVQQAMAHGLPVIVAEGDGTQNDLATPENGWLVPPGELPALEEALLDALSDTARLRRMGEESHRLARERFNIETMASVFVHVLNTLTGAH
jgi:glycosyltransferase involved in cell wall biosynthesis